jgi:hypothetical protein
MNEKQQRFHDFVMEGVEPGCEDEARSLLNEGIARQNEGTYDIEYIETISPKYEKLIRPSHWQAVKNAIKSEIDLLNKA